MSCFKDTAQQILSIADIRIGGDRSWDIQYHREETFRHVFRYGSIGLGEAYMEGWWDVQRLDEFFTRVLRAGLESRISKLKYFLPVVKAYLFDFQSRANAFHVGRTHYDLGNDFFRRMLGKRMVYSCAYWKDSNTLDDAQTAKLDLVCRKIGLQSGHKVLDIGCGWGAFAKFAAQEYGAHVVGITVSKQQAELGCELCQGMPVELRLQSYREVNEQFDHIVSLGMFEHVGLRNYKDYMQVVRRCLKENGLFLLHTIGTKSSTLITDPWVNKYIFPNGKIPSLQQIVSAADDLFVIEDMHNFGADYDKTLMNWYWNFDQAWPEFNQQFGERFYRMWKYYLLCCAGAFRARDLHLWQIVLSPQGVPGGYNRV